MPQDLGNNWVFRNKLHHLLFWTVYHSLWWLSFASDGNNSIDIFFNFPSAVKFSFYVVIQAIGVYFCLYYLIPKYLERGHNWRFLLSTIATIFLISLLIFSGYFVAAYLGKSTVSEIYLKGEQDTLFKLFKNNAFPSSLASMTLGLSIKLAKNYLEAYKKQQLLEQEKLETELKFLKSQFNPHFLFNTINSIFVLINKNTQMATDSLAKFSGLLRYQLYECNESQIPLSRELDYLQSFIELEELRLNENFRVEKSLPHRISGNYMIAPFILMPFIENAFKHVSQHTEHENWIRIKLAVMNDEMFFNIENSVSSDHSGGEVVDYSGLGLGNVRRRLDLLYTDQFELKINEEPGRFEVALKVKLTSISNFDPQPVFTS